MTAPKPIWWKSASCYQIWPASYKDSNGDGIGDIPGIIGTLDYLKDLGIDVVWLSPMYDSPQVDMGYDISNYQDIYKPYGTMADMDNLIKECKKRDMKLILDLVINHTSDQHAWFKESRKNKTNKYADWYIWRDPKIINGEKHPPNNWKAIFGGSAWEYVPERDQYYLHLFVAEQPDLNWENPETRQGIYQNAIAFWLDRGIDGFRVDTVNLYSKHVDFPDAPVVLPDEPYQAAFQYFSNGPRMHEFLREQRKDVLSKYGDVVMVGELAGADAATVLSYVSAEVDELSCVFDFDVVSLGGRHGANIKKHQTYKHTLPEFKEAFKKVQELVNTTDAWGTVFLENHDQGRSLSRFATDADEHREQASKMLATLLCTLTGTLFIYQGQEIGMVNHPDTWGVEELRDIDSLNAYNEIKDRYDGDPLWCKKAMRGIQRVGRDNARLPVHWDSSKNGGFTTGQPWIRVNDNYQQINVADQQKDPSSPLNFWKKMLKVRKEYADLMIFGDFTVHNMAEVDTFVYTKTKDGKKLLVMLSFSNAEEPLDLPIDIKESQMKLLVSTTEKPGKYLAPWEGRVYLVE